MRVQKSRAGDHWIVTGCYLAPVAFGSWQDAVAFALYVVSILR